MIAGLVATHDHEPARRSIRALRRAAGGPALPGNRADGPIAWLGGAKPASGRPGGRPDADPVVVLEGRLYDTGERDARAGIPARGRSADDAHVVATRWREAGPSTLRRMVGDFAFALWDPLARELALATDPLGVVPLYYAQSPDRTMLAFASRTNPLRALDWIGSEPDDETVVASLVNLAAEPGRTFHRAIRTVPGGHCVRWQDGRIRVERYWGPHFARPDIRSVDDMLEAFEHAVRTAVRDRLDPSRRTAILLSGGYDSTAVAGAVAAIRRESPDAVPPVIALSGVFPGLDCDESRRIDIALADNGLPGRRFDPLGRGVTVESMRNDVVRHDAPLIGFQAPFADAYAALAREFGAATLLTGLGGDELTIDFDYQIDFARAMGWRRFPETVRRVAGYENHSPRRVALRLLRERCPEPLKRPWRAIRDLVSAPSRTGTGAGWLEPGARILAESLRRRPPPPAVDFDSHSKEVRWRVATSPTVEAARRWFALEAQAAGFELASPLLDRRLFELVFSADARWHPRSYDRGEYKPLIARGLPYAPRGLVGAFWKVDFRSYDMHVVTRSLPLIDEWLFAGQAWRSGKYVSRDAAMRSVAAFRHEPERLLFRVGAIVGLETWMRSLGEAGRAP